MYKTAAVFVALAASANAFAPGASLKRPVAPRIASRGQVAMFDPSQQYGVLKPVGFFDPLGLSKGISEEKFFRWREIEIKHGRVCMVAFIGFIWQQGLGHLPGYISHHPDLKFSDIPDGVAAIGAVPGLGWAQILWFAGLLELGPFSVYNRREERPGAFNYFKWGGNDVGEAYPGLTDENRIQKLTIELQNGRLAMLGVLGMLMGDVVAPGTMGLPTADGIGLF
jgi:hypothetical protein